jgi:hypothetical protein
MKVGRPSVQGLAFSRAEARSSTRLSS